MSKSWHEAENLAKAICGCSDMSQHRVDTKLLIEYAKAAALAKQAQVVAQIVAMIKRAGGASVEEDQAAPGDPSKRNFAAAYETCASLVRAIERGEHTEPSA